MIPSRSGRPVSTDLALLSVTESEEFGETERSITRAQLNLSPTEVFLPFASPDTLSEALSCVFAADFVSSPAVFLPPAASCHFRLCCQPYLDAGSGLGSIYNLDGADTQFSSDTPFWQTLTAA